MREELLRLIPEFELIKDEGLREKTIGVFLKALDLGGWKPEDLNRMPFTLLIEECPANMVEHVRGNVLVSSAIAGVLSDLYGKRMPINKDHLLAGSLLHDVGKLLEYREEGGKFVKSDRGKLLRHPFSGAGLCFEAGLPDEVTHIVAMHAKEGEGGKRTTEGVICHYADFINFVPFKG